MSEEPHHDVEADSWSPEVDPVHARAVEAFFVLYGRMHCYYGRVSEAHDLTPQLASILRGLATPSPMRELARRLRMDASNLTGLVDRLEQRGLVERRADADDRRVKTLSLTAAGVELRDALNTCLMADPPLLAGLDPEQRSRLSDLLGLAAAARTLPAEPG